MSASSAIRSGSPAPAYLALSCVGFLAFPGGAQAQEADEPARLGGVTVTDTEVDASPLKVERASSPKFTAPLIDTPRSVTILPEALLRDTASASLADALRNIPGITLGAGEGGNPLGDRPFIRGFDSQTSTYLDGVRDIGAQSRDVFAVEQIEVVKGSDSSMGGRGAAGGSINLVTKAPTDERFAAASGSLGSSDYKRATIDLNQSLSDFVGVRLNAMWHDQDVAGRDAIWSKRWGVAPSIKLGLAGPTSLTIDAYHLESDELPDSGIPYLYTSGNVPAGITETAPAEDFTSIGGVRIQRPRGAFYGLANRDFRDTNVTSLTARAEHRFDSGLTLRNTTRFGRSSQSYLWTQPDDQQGNVYGTNAASPATAGGLVWRRINSRYSEAEGILNQTDLFGDGFLVFGHSFAASLELSSEKAANGNYVGSALTGAAIASGATQSPRCTPAMFDRLNCTTVASPNPADPWVSYASDTSTAPGGIERSLEKTWTLSRADSIGASFFDTITLSEQLLLNLGLRYDHYKTKMAPGLPLAGNGERQWIVRRDDLWNWQAGLVWKPAPNGSIYLSAATSSTPPGSYLAQGSEPNGLTPGRGEGAFDPDDLKVERTRSYEFGTKWSLFDEGLALSAALFQTETKNARAAGENNQVTFVGERRIRGLELGFNGNVTPRWSVFGGYTYMDAKIRDGGITTTVIGGVPWFGPSVNTGKPFPNTPKHSFTAFSEYDVTRAFSIGGGATYMSKVYGGFQEVGARTVSNGQLVLPPTLARMVPGYWRFDANASLRLNEAVSIRANIQNLTNKLYYDKAYTAHYATQAPGRTAILSLDFRY